MQNPPTYAIASVDSALLLVTVLQHEGAIRVTDAADRLGVSVSTAHRLLRMLVHRDFAEQQPDRRYAAGPALRRTPVPPAPAAGLRGVVLPLLRTLVDAVGESANLVVLSGPEVRFVATVECEHALRVGDRTGRFLPAHRASGGKALLAALDPAALMAVLEAAVDLEPDLDLSCLHRELRSIRRRGYAVNDRQTEAGLTAVGVALPPVVGNLGAALSIAAPTARVTRGLTELWASALRGAAQKSAGQLGR